MENDLKVLIDAIEKASAADLGGGIFKYRLSVKSKNKGKSGGFRVITFELLVAENDKDITLLTIYDKSEQPSISKPQILRILKDEGLI
ncbi:MAG: type II toxin-antitoxin system RelE/ParE family toxin [Prolixibacteraceae bacterium]